MIIVCPLNRVQPLVEEHAVSHVVSLLGPDTPHRPFHGVGSARHLRLTFHDIAEPIEGYTQPKAADAERLLRFVDGWDGTDPLLIHCWAGISRSTAAAYAALCLFAPRTDEEELAWTLREASPSATPNRLIVSHADSLLGRGGRMVRAVEKIGRGAEVFEGEPFFLHPRRESYRPA